jgi:serine/threonine-protein kinase
MTNAKLILPTVVILIAGCGANLPPTQTPNPTHTPVPVNNVSQPTSSIVASSDGLTLTLAPGVTMKLVRVPAGEFLMGSVDMDADAEPAEKPQHRVNLDEYLIGKYDVTNAEYAVFMRATNRVWSKPAGKENHPVVNVTWSDAVAFCQWLSQVTGRKVQLPSEAQWEKAARGTDGRKYPWGNEEPVANQLNFNNNVNDTTPVGQYSPYSDSPYEAADMAGNVFQWTSSLKKPYPYQADDGRENLQSRDWRVVRGGGFIVGRRGVRSASRVGYNPISRYDDVGFRVIVFVQ